MASWTVVSETIERIRELELALARERDRTRALREVGLLLDSTLRIEDLLQRILGAAARVTEAERGTLYLLEPDGRTLVSRLLDGGEGGFKITLPVGEGIAGRAAGERRTVRVDDAYADPRFDRAWDGRTGFHTRNILATPMVSPLGRVVGVLQVLNHRERPFDADDEAVLEALAAQAAVALEGAARYRATIEQNRALTELRAKLEYRLRERDLLLSVEQLLARADTLDDFLHGALEDVVEVCEALSGAVVLVDPVSGEPVYRAVRGPDAEALRGRSVPAGDEVVRQVLETGAARLLDAREGAAEAFEAAATRVAVALPGEGGPSGVLQIVGRRAGSFTVEHVSLLVLVAVNIATGVELARARAERERATRLAGVGRILSNVLHDVRTPMTIISGYAQLMANAEAQAERTRYAQLVRRQFEHVNAMIGELLAFVRGESNLLVHKVHVRSFFDETVEMLRRELEGRGLEIELEVRDRGFARFDAAKITRLVHNLGRNAAEAVAARGAGRFRVQVDREGEELVLTFCDDGPGIPEGVLPRLFQSFVSEGKPGGTGLGLAIVKKIVDEHRGQLAVATGEGGTTFTVRLPTGGPPGSASGTMVALADG